MTTTDDRQPMTASTESQEPGAEGNRRSVAGDRWSAVALGPLLIGAGLRFYRFDAQKLWFDELYTAELARQGLGAIWRNSFVQLTPPLPYLLFWAAAQLGGLSAFSLRMVLALAAVAALLVYYRYCKSTAGGWVALLASGLLAGAPLAVYYAQEARPYALALLALLLTLPAFERLRARGRAADWGLYALLAVIASQLHYVNIVLVGAQLVALLIIADDRRRVVLGGACTVLAVAAALGPFMLGVHTSGREWAGWQAPQATLDLRSTLQTMVAGDARIAPAAARTIALIAVGWGAALALLERRDWPLLLPHLLQIAFALLVAFVLLPLAGVPAPAYEERPFLLVLPSALFCFSVGVRRLAARNIGWLLAGGLIVALGATSLAGLMGYYGGFVKSPEALMADQIAGRALPGDIALGDAYSVDAALRFYHPELPVYRYWREQAGRAVFLANNTVLMDKPAEQLASLAELTRNRRIWLLQSRAAPLPYVAELQAHHQTRETLQVPPFRAWLLERRP